MIVIGGMIGVGKTTTAKMLEKELGLPTYFESVRGNEILSLFYTATPEEKKKMRYPFLSQLSFLRARFNTLRNASKEENAILDRSLYEDCYFAKKNYELGNINELEMKVYDSFAKEIFETLNDFKNEKENFLVYLHGSFETVFKRIKSRGRSFEIDPELVSYYKFIYDGYDEMIKRAYPKERIIDINIDELDLKYDPKAKEYLLTQLKEKGAI